MVLFHVHNRLLYARSVLQKWSPIKTDVPALAPLCYSQPANLLPLKMGVFDGVYKLDMTQADPNWSALHKEMGKKDL